MNRIKHKWQCVTSDTRSWRAVTCPLLNHLLWRKPGVMFWGHSFSLTKRSMWQGPNASCQQPCEYAILEMCLQIQSSLQMTGWHLDCNLMKDLDPDMPNKAIPIYDHRTWKIINVYCFKLRNFGMICYTAIDTNTIYHTEWI